MNEVNDTIKGAIIQAAKQNKKLTEKAGIFHFYADDDTIEAKLDIYAEDGENFANTAERIQESAEEANAEYIAEELCQNAVNWLSDEEAKFFDHEKNEELAEQWIIDELLDAETSEDYDKTVEALNDAGAYEDSEGNIRYEEDTAAKDAWLSSRGI